ncbi:hypothetical protein [Tuwongella immobilis]|uniref:Peptidase MA-like domain-containing protein n=1 Tax=Tuwongella immobilis TaxID=692036 RepID=A0A6C2YUJ3_9BACT|nr:hypothetical protein [Tuwongella immobilis]VIP04709.1 Uncharacterized protein OS=Singulisphaera acidiphila (strain ATCC BAA-1392 / DSM 18658 / VKM B-2454 / MOB10) GN=Sinac_5098 PE=4 SV=1: Peptidase_MA_2 [Tuwongella immobilis]VTS06777.1 Uncharacterized protein OS=Singulisphaera acidiphila (strain ATCC BAA-1392 / DSM 18658 / VKM B-2454 / MOB10) GN=Sinac_5098 PE=4 SV=1: Peptidase_MA_2 [Tuwongella immobilis]
MTTRRIGFLAVLLLVMNSGLSTAASYRTPNFVVEAATPQLAAEFGQLAEKYRREKAIEWLGREMPQWPTPCPLKVQVTMGGAGGATSFNFEGSRIYQSMQIEGALDRLKVSVLPHEITHTVFAHHFRQPVPRWADEGGAVYSEDDLERNRHDSMCRQQLNAGRAFQLRVLFGLKEYPQDVPVLYAEGFSVTAFLIEQGDRQRFLNFVGAGMQQGWDAAVATYYAPYRSVADLERAWLDYLKGTKSGQFVRNMQQRRGEAVSAVASNTPATTEYTNRVIVRDFTPPAQPQLDPAFRARGASPSNADLVGWNNNGPVQLGRPQFNNDAMVPSDADVAPRRTPAYTVSNPSPNRPISQPSSSAFDPRPGMAVGNSNASLPPPVLLFPPERNY